MAKRRGRFWRFQVEVRNAEAVGDEIALSITFCKSQAAAERHMDTLDCAMKDVAVYVEDRRCRYPWRFSRRPMRRIHYAYVSSYSDAV